MIWKKLKRVIYIPLIVVKFVIFCFFPFQSDCNQYFKGYKLQLQLSAGFDNDSPIIKDKSLSALSAMKRIPAFPLNCGVGIKTGNKEKKKGRFPCR